MSCWWAVNDQVLCGEAENRGKSPKSKTAVERNLTQISFIFSPLSGAALQGKLIFHAIVSWLNPNLFLHLRDETAFVISPLSYGDFQRRSIRSGDDSHEHSYIWCHWRCPQTARIKPQRMRSVGGLSCTFTRQIVLLQNAEPPKHLLVFSTEQNLTEVLQVK